ncbi:hypothetical protein SY83_12085 [Paenibacillus swuensis]|uniref:Iron permease n=1 Tax=Paenibacillus swuensis TaxID=1178515 RepID=A0A172TJC3_9BACL|nr:FTR1 family protein [Paenibacillus swuensis]ANE46893.1 hypothetical protein SY83_12085 [Paenibacillus swuensis]
MKRIGHILTTILMLVLVLPLGFPYVAGAQPTTDTLHKQLISYSSDALISSGDTDWATVLEAVTGIRAALPVLSEEKSEDSKALLMALQGAEKALKTADSDPDGAKKAVSLLAKATDAYVSADDQGNESGQIQSNLKALLPLLKDTLKAVENGNLPAAIEIYNRFITAWGKAETAIRREDGELYGRIEVKLSGARIALTAEMPDPEKSAQKLQELITIAEDYIAGRTTSSSSSSVDGVSIHSIAGLITLVEQVKWDLEKSQAEAASAKMETFITAWPELEGEVRTRSQQAYRDIENDMISLSSGLLAAKPDYDNVSRKADQLIIKLEPYAQASAYTAWDAFAILFREGVEAILIVASLLALLKRSGHENKRKWIWSGAAAGIAVSVILALVLSVFLSNMATGSSREFVEGISSLIAVLFMVTVGAWLHGKSNVHNWNRFMERTIGASLAKGALWSLSITAFLTVMREGAETIIFYIGMAPSIAVSDIMLGIGAAVVVLAVIAFAVKKLSARIPVRPFFRVAGLLMYYMAFKFLGVGIHALQVAGTLPAHATTAVPEIPSLGTYQSWEVLIPQGLVLLFIMVTILRVERSKKPTGQPVTPL